METALPRRLVISAVVCQAGAFSPEHASRLRGALIGSRGLLALGTYRAGLGVSCYNCFGNDKEHSKEYKFCFCFKGRVEADGPVTEGVLVRAPLET